MFGYLYDSKNQPNGISFIVYQTLYMKIEYRILLKRIYDINNHSLNMRYIIDQIKEILATHDTLNYIVSRKYTQNIIYNLYLFLVNGKEYANVHEYRISNL